MRAIMRVAALRPLGGRNAVGAARLAAGRHRRRLATITGVTGGAMSEVPGRLGQAFSAFWNRQHDSYPPGTTVESLHPLNHP